MMNFDLAKLDERISLRAKVTFLATGIALTCILSTLAISYFRSRGALTDLAKNQLQSLSTSAVKRVTEYFHRTENFTSILAENRLIEGLFLAYESAFYGAGLHIGKDEKLTASSFADLDKTYKSKTDALISSYDLANFFLVNISGQVVFSARGSEYGYFAGRSLSNGELKGSNLAQCYSSAMDGSPGGVHFSDYEYVPALDRTVSFMCVKAFAEFDHLSEGIKKGDAMGVVVSEINLPYINDMLLARDGMGETGHIYLVGDDLVLRSDMILDRERNNLTVAHKTKAKYDSESIQDALRKKSGSDVITGPLGQKVMSAYVPVEINGRTWAVISEKRMSEVLRPVDTLLYFILGVAGVLFVLIIFITASVTSILVKPITLASSTLQTVSDALTNGARDLTSSSEVLSTSARDQASSLQQTMAAIDEVSTTIRTNAENAQMSQSVSQTSLEAANRGRVVVNEMIVSMGEIDQSNQQISDQLDATNARLMEIVALIRDIGTKTQVINDIVFQTKLLSFNASVEAARAGEHGKGFAVVAEEVGNLAQMSGNAAKEISKMLEDSIKQVETMVDETRSSIQQFTATGHEKVAMGTQTAQRCGQVLDEIVANVRRVADMVAQISQASAEQTEAMNEISKAMMHLNQGTDNTARISVSSAESAEKLEGQSDTLKDVVDTLVRTLRGAA